MIVLRLLLILVGYAVALLAASIFLVAIQRQGLQGPTDDLPMMLIMTFLGSVIPTWLFLAANASIPACVAIILSERRGRRDWQTHVIAGAVLGAIILVFWNFYGKDDIGLPPYVGSLLSEPDMLWEMVVAGAIAGLFYWLMAGSWAGDWLRPTSPGPTGS